MLLWQVLSCFLALQLLFGWIISFLFLKIWFKKRFVGLLLISLLFLLILQALLYVSALH